MTAASKDRYLILGLLILSAVPLLASTVRLLQLSGSVPMTPDAARHTVAPLALMLHIVSASIYSVLGALQFASELRRRKPRLHRIAGRVVVLCGMVAALSALWLTQFTPPASVPPASFDGPALYVIRWIVGISMVVALCCAVIAIRKRDIAVHRAWMIRAYALGLGAGTQVFTHIPWFVFPEIQGELSRAICMGAGWAINAIVAEWMIRRTGQAPRASSTRAARQAAV